MPTKSTPYKIDARQNRGRPREHPLTDFELQHDQDTTSGLRRTEPSVNRPGWLSWNLGPREIFIDGEWHFNTTPQKFYLLGYCYDHSHFGWLYNQNDYTYGDKIMYKPKHRGVDRLNRTWLLKLFDGVEKIYFYGPDAGQIERMYHIRLKDRYKCINLLTLVKKVVPVETMMQATREYDKLHPGVLSDPSKVSYRLCVVEHLLGLRRTTEEYKADVDNLHRDWYNPKLRAKALLYNKEDVINLLEVKRRLYRRFSIPSRLESECALQVTEKDKDKFKSRK